MADNQKRAIFRRKISIVFFVLYLIILVYFLFFAENMGRVTAERDYSYNLVPLKEIKRFIKYRQILGAKAVWLNIAGNVAAFVPFGLFVIPVCDRKIKLAEAVILTIDVSLSVEIIQLFTKRGSFDVDDILLNTLGGIIGAIAYLIHKRMERKGHNGQA